MKTPNFHSRRTGAALIIILVFVVLLTVVCVAFFTTVTGERQLSAASVQQSKARMLARSAVDDITGMLKDEIAAGSEPGKEFSPDRQSIDLKVPGRCFSPLQPANAAPYRYPGASGNLLKWSTSNQSFYTGSAYDTSGIPPFPGASDLKTEDPSSSKNGRFVSSSRWEKSALAPSGTLPTPQWIYLARDGSHPRDWSASLSDSAASNRSFVVGRYAFMLYDVGGLLDLNAAGYPATANPTEIRKKGPLGFVDLSIIDPKLPNAVAWRNVGTSGTFPSTVISANNTYLLASPGDRLFTGRQQMLKYLESLGVAATSFPLLTHFTREVNAPAWGPTADANDAILGGNGTNEYKYSSNKNNDSAINRLLPNVRTASAGANVVAYDVSGRAFTYRPNAGDPLIRRRFSLDKLAWLGKDGPNPSGFASALTSIQRSEAIQSCFGLVWDASNKTWIYAGSSGRNAVDSIATLAQVASQGREPNFFELLKAGILHGSTGLLTARIPMGGDIVAINDLLPFNDSNARPYNGFLTATNTQQKDSQIIQIGLNILDQYDTDSYPARIQFRNFEFYGRENIPYLYRLSQISYRAINPPAPMTPGGSDRLVVAAWLEPTVWTPTIGPVTDQPTAMRIRLVAGTVNYFFQQNPAPTSNPPSSPAATAGAYITFSGNNLSSQAADPKPIGNLGADVSFQTTRSEYVFNGDGYKWVGFYGGEKLLDGGNTLFVSVFTLNGDPNNGGPRFVLEADYNGTWKEIQRLGFGATGGFWNGVSGPASDRCRIPVRLDQWGYNDPRTQRFGIQRFDITSTSQNLLSGSMFWVPSGNLYFNTSFNPRDSNFAGTFSAGDVWATFPMYRIADNTGSPRYTDPDGVQRSADGVWTGTATNTLPMRREADYRPVQLNRPFRNPGEIGYAFRDLPWRSLDFSSPKSADSGLLELFCTGAEGGEDALLAGRVNLNSRQPAVIKAMLTGASRVESSTSMSLTSSSADMPSTTADTIAAALVNATELKPLLTRASIVTDFMQNAAVGSAFSGDIKARRESVVRALSQAGQTRTWNLMFDVIAQTGRLSADARSLRDFVVEGERRVWAHVALDRYTGRVVDIQIEQVDE